MIAIAVFGLISLQSCSVNKEQCPAYERIQGKV